jgi:hypothetical protein
MDALIVTTGLGCLTRAERAGNYLSVLLIDKENLEGVKE